MSEKCAATVKDKGGEERGCEKPPLSGIGKCGTHATAKEKAQRTAALRKAAKASLNVPVTASGSNSRACNPDLLALPVGYKRAFINVVESRKSVKEQTRVAIVEAAQASLGCAEEGGALFLRGGVLVLVQLQQTARTERDDLTEDDYLICSPGVRVAEKDLLKAVMRIVADFVVPDEHNGWKEVDPPMDLVGEIVAEGDLPIAHLDAITTVPFVRSDYSIANEPGYYGGAERLLLIDDPETEWRLVPDVPTYDDWLEATEHIDLLVDGFPFVGGADRTNAVAALVTPALVNRLPLRPMHLIDAKKPGTGKTKFTNLVQYTYMAREILLTLKPSEEERQKTLETAMLSAPLMLVWDNVHGEVDSPGFAMMLTASAMRFRVLGAHADVEVPNRTAHFMTGNNMKTSDEIGDRASFIRLDAKMEEPGTRTDFDYSIPTDVLAMRAKTLWSVHVLIRWWVAQGKPRWRGKFRASFEDWAEIVGGIVEAAGYEGFQTNLAASKAASRSGASEIEQARIAAFYLYKIGEPVTAKQIADDHYSGYAGEAWDSLLKPGLDPGQKRRALGAALSKMDGATASVIEDCQCADDSECVCVPVDYTIRMKQNRDKVNVYWVEPTSG